MIGARVGAIWCMLVQFAACGSDVAGAKPDCGTAVVFYRPATDGGSLPVCPFTAGQMNQEWQRGTDCGDGLHVECSRFNSAVPFPCSFEQRVCREPGPTEPLATCWQASLVCVAECPGVRHG